MSTPTPITLRIFVSSPGDVAEERFLCEKVLARLGDRYRRVCVIEPIFWEHEPLLATAAFQTQLPSPADTDIVICVLWSRIGTRLPPGVPGEGQTGTQYEFTEAVRGRRERGLPDLLVYRKDAPPVVRLDQEEQVLTALQQKRALDEFIQSWFHGADGTLLAAFHSFRDGAMFEEHLEAHLRKLIEQRLQKANVDFDELALQSATWKDGSPFRGLNFFDFEHGAIFFGRTRAVSELVDRLKRQAATGRAFVLVLGASGSGKSSLVRAGVLPLLSQPGVIPGVGLCRRAVFRPGDGLTDDKTHTHGAARKDLFDGLAAALLKPNALPEIAADGTTPAQLAVMLRDNPAGLSILVKGALSQAAASLTPASDTSPQPEARLLFVVDQLEELFTLDPITDDHRSRFAAALSALATGGRTWVLATLRSDFYSQLAKVPELVQLKEGFGQYDVQLPTPAELGQMIRQPAEAAALRFEQRESDGERLDEVLRDAAVRNPDSLPLLEFTLDLLFDRKIDRGRLTFAAYTELGELEGAIATRAEAVFASLDSEVQATLPSVFRQLVTISGQSDEPPTRKQSARTLLETTDAQRQFTQAFIEARLFLSDLGDDGKPVVRITHESLLTRWERLQSWLVNDRELLQIRSRVNAAASRWEKFHRRKDLLLSDGKPLYEANQLTRSDITLENEVKEYCELSRQLVQQNLHRRRLAVWSMAILTVLSFIASGVAWVFYSEADAQRIAAQEQEEKTNEAKSRLAEQNIESTELLLKAAQTERASAKTLWDYGRKREAFAHWARALDYDPLSALSVEQALTGFTKSPFPQVITRLSGHASSITCVAFSPDGTRAVTGSSGGALLFWDIATGARISTLLGEYSSVLSVAYGPDGSRIVAGFSDDTARILDNATGKVLASLDGHAADVRCVAYFSNGTRIATGSDDRTAKLWDVANGQLQNTLTGHDGAISGIAFSPDGTRIATSSSDNTARVWDVVSGQTLVTFTGHEDDVSCVAYSPDGAHIVTGSLDDTVQIWDASSGATIRSLIAYDEEVVGVRRNDPLTVLERRDEVCGVAYSLDGCRLVGLHKTLLFKMDKATLLSNIDDIQKHKLPSFTTSKDWIAKVWDADTGVTLATLTEGWYGVESVAFSPDGMRLAIGSEDGVARIWDAGHSDFSFTTKAEAKYNMAGLRNLQFLDPAKELIGKPLPVLDTSLLGEVGLQALDSRHGTPPEWFKTYLLPDFNEHRGSVIHGTPPVWFKTLLRYLARRSHSTNGEVVDFPSSQEEDTQIIDGLHMAISADNSVYGNIARYFLTPFPERPIRPGLKVTCRDAADSLIQPAATRADIELAYGFYPGHPLVQIALAKYTADNRRAAFLREYGVCRLRADAAICRRAAELLIDQQDSPRATRALDQATRLDPKHPDLSRLRIAIDTIPLNTSSSTVPPIEESPESTTTQGK